MCPYLVNLTRHIKALFEFLCAGSNVCFCGMFNGLLIHMRCCEVVFDLFGLGQRVGIIDVGKAPARGGCFFS